MRFVVTGAAGHVSKPLTELLLGRKHEVTVIGRNGENVAELKRQGAKSAIGDIQDVHFLTKAFEGADAVYLMIPPMRQASDLKKISTEIAEGFSTAIKSSGVRNAVFLSSYGAHRLNDAGAISGLGLAELVLNRLEGVNVLHLRAGYFFTNLLLSIDLIKKSGFMGNMFTIPAGTFTLADTDDIALAAADALTKLDFEGHSYKYVVSDESGTDEIASLIGPSSNSSWSICFTDPYGSRRKPSVDERTAARYFQVSPSCAASLSRPLCRHGSRTKAAMSYRYTSVKSPHSSRSSSGLRGRSRARPRQGAGLCAIANELRLRRIYRLGEQIAIP
jgi:uncharacterized protein YbjT (DUF2867 family)